MLCCVNIQYSYRRYKTVCFANKEGRFFVLRHIGVDVWIKMIEYKLIWRCCYSSLLPGRKKWKCKLVRCVYLSQGINSQLGIIYLFFRYTFSYTIYNTYRLRYITTTPPFVSTISNLSYCVDILRKHHSII